MDEAHQAGSIEPSLTEIGGTFDEMARIFIVPLWGPSSFRRFAVEIVLTMLSEPLFHAQRQREKRGG